ncbi:MAG: hypothetical protein DELT_00239 [Desulfovibrio sp.]
MKSLIVYSSLTGNTKMIAEAVAKALPEGGYDIFPVAEAPAADGYDFVAIGYWVDKGMADAKCKEYMATVTGKKVALFGTLGVDPSHDHAKECAKKGEDMMREGGNTVYGTFLSQGKIDPKIVEAMKKMAKDVHPMTPERIARIEEAKKHPNEDDCRRATETFKEFYRAASA